MLCWLAKWTALCCTEKSQIWFLLLYCTRCTERSCFNVYPQYCALSFYTLLCCILHKCTLHNYCSEWCTILIYAYYTEVYSINSNILLPYYLLWFTLSCYIVLHCTAGGESSVLDYIHCTVHHFVYSTLTVALAYTAVGRSGTAPGSPPLPPR